METKVFFFRLLNKNKLFMIIITQTHFCALFYPKKNPERNGRFLETRQKNEIKSEREQCQLRNFSMQAIWMKSFAILFFAVPLLCGCCCFCCCWKAFVTLQVILVHPFWFGRMHACMRTNGKHFHSLVYLALLFKSLWISKSAFAQ